MTWLVGLLLFAAADARGQTGTLPSVETREPATEAPAPPAEPGEPADTEAPDSPRASARTFIELAGVKGDFSAAGRYLVLSPDNEARGAILARRLTAVLERRLDIHLDAMSPESDGRQDDGLPAGVDLVGHVSDGEGGEDPVYVVRTRDDRGAYWAFSRHTVERVDAWYDGLEDRWIRDLLPEPLLRLGPRGLMWWQWLAFPLLALAALAIGRMLGGFTRAILHRWFSRTRTTWDDRLLERIGLGLTLLWAIAAFRTLLPWLALLPEATRFIDTLLAASVVVVTFWALWRSVDVIVEMLLERPWALGNASARSLLSVGGNLIKAAVVVSGVVTAVATFGYPVATVLAGLGIGGIALAFGAQKTVENLFGSVALATDQPCRVGDFVKIEEFVGTVESIGTRSTRIRTLDRTLITIPNGRLSDMRIESYTVRDRIRLSTTIGVVYETTEAQMQRILSGTEQVLRAHPKIWPDTVVVRFAGFGDSSLDIEVMCWFQTTDFNEFRDCRQDVLLGFMRVVEEAGSGFAFPTRTVHLVTEPPSAPARPAGL